MYLEQISVTYDHRLKKTGHPVCSGILKLQIGRLVVGWVTTSEYLLLYVLGSLFLFVCFFGSFCVLVLVYSICFGGGKEGVRCVLRFHTHELVSHLIAARVASRDLTVVSYYID